MRRLILVSGANGYIGRRLVPLLLARGCEVRCLVRDPASLAGCEWLPAVQIVRGEAVTGEALEEAMQGVTAAYYLIHSMSSGPGYHILDLAAADQFAAAAGRAAVEQIVYLGGLASPGEPMAWHMRSRMLTGEALRAGRVPVTEFRAGVIVGPGSISFEMIRWLTEQFPILVGPGWLRHRVQPAASADVLAYLLAAIDRPASRGRVLELGGPDVMTYLEAMLIYARLRGLRRGAVLLPGLPVGWLSRIVGRLTPVPASIAAPLIDGLRGDSVVTDPSARSIFPEICPIGYQEAVAGALQETRPDRVERGWGGAGIPGRIVRHEGFFVDHREARLEVPPAAAFAAFIRLGGPGGWRYLDPLWQLRGRIDRLFGGPGMRGRFSREELEVGGVVDFYRVEALEPGRLLRLRAELKAPGEGWMEWQARPDRPGGSILSQTAFFAPRGAAGHLYWHLLHPLHRLVFAGLFRKLAAEAGQQRPPGSARLVKGGHS